MEIAGLARSARREAGTSKGICEARRSTRSTGPSDGGATLPVVRPVIVNIRHHVSCAGVAAMISLMYTRTMPAYNRWMNNRLYDCCSKLSDEERKRDLIWLPELQRESV
jgi:hypothetical protein